MRSRRVITLSLRDAQQLVLHFAAPLLAQQLPAWPWPDSGLRISWAMLAVSRPSEASFSCCACSRIRPTSSGRPAPPHPELLVPRNGRSGRGLRHNGVASCPPLAARQRERVTQARRDGSEGTGASTGANRACPVHRIGTIQHALAQISTPSCIRLR